MKLERNPFLESRRHLHGVWSVVCVSRCASRAAALRFAPPLWYAVVSSPLGGLVAIAPGFVAGWLSHNKGILAGFMAGVFGQAIYAGTMHTMWSTVVEDGAVLEMVVRLLALGLSAAFVSAASAGAALFLRSNNALHATREDARA